MIDGLDVGKLLLLLIPILLVNYGMVIYCIIDMFKVERKVKGGNKIVWLLVVGLVNMFGWITYLLIGREE